jgi:hypothetical protein
MSFDQLIEGCLTSGSQPTLVSQTDIFDSLVHLMSLSSQWLSYNDRYIERLSAAGKDRSELVSETWGRSTMSTAERRLLIGHFFTVALLTKLDKYGNTSGLPASYIQEALASTRYPVGSLLHVIVRTLDYGFSSDTIEAVSSMLLNSPEFGKKNSMKFDRPTKRDSDTIELEKPFGFVRHILHLLSAETPSTNEIVAQLVTGQQTQEIPTRPGEMSAAARALLGDTSLAIPPAIRKALTLYVESSAGSDEHNGDEDSFRDQPQEQRPLRPATPDPLTEELPNGTIAAGKTYKYIKTPVYITAAVQNALELGWHWCSPRRGDPRCSVSYQKAEEELGSAPDSYRDLIHLTSALVTKPSTMLYFLVQASFEMLFESIDSLQKADKQEAQRLLTGEDQIMLGIAAAAPNTRRDRIATKMLKTGWKELIWTLHGLISALQYWRWLTVRDEANWQCSKGWKSPVRSRSLDNFPTSCLSAVGL